MLIPFLLLYQFVPGGREDLSGFGRQVTVLRRGKFIDQRGKFYIACSSFSNKFSHTFLLSSAPKNGINLSAILNELFQEAYLRLCITVRKMTPCHVLSLTEDVNVIEDGQIELLLTAMVGFHHRFVGILSSNFYFECLGSSSLSFEQTIKYSTSNIPE
jgi:hypothetical protein